MASIISDYSQEIAIRGTEIELSARADEHLHRFVIAVRKKIGTVLNKAGGVLQKAGQASSKHQVMKPLHQRIEPLSQRIQEEEATNNKKIEEEEEIVAWATIRKILGACVRRKAVPVKIASDIVEVTYLTSLPEYSSEKPASPPPTSKPWKIRLASELRKLQLPDCGCLNPKLTIESPSIQLPHIDLELDLTNVNIDLPEMNLKDLQVSLPDIPEIHMNGPQIDLPTMEVPLPKMPNLKLPETTLFNNPIVRKVTDKLVELAVEKAVDKEMDLLEKTIDPKPHLSQLEARLDQVTKEQFKEEGTECLEATKVIVKYRTKEYRQKVAWCWNSSMGKIRDGLKTMHKKMASCVNSPLETQRMQ